MLGRSYVPWFAALLCASSACTTYTTGGGSGGGGAGGSGGCATPADCPGEDTYCGERTCVANVCGFNIKAPPGTEASTQPVGDCKTLVCDDAGSVVAQANSSDVMNDGNPCTKDECMGTTPTHTNLDAGADCGQGLTCDGAGVCIGCDGPADCGPPGDCFTWLCDNSQCVPEPLSNGTNCTDGACHICQDGSCVKAQAAQDPGDLCPGPDTCNANGLCRCGDGAKNGNESDIDCGGDGCDHCPDGKTCNEASDCASGFCADGVCCNAPCEGNCQACDVDGSVGSCEMILEGGADPTCLSGLCGIGGFCACVDAGDCVNNEQCIQPPSAQDSPICFTPLQKGQPCPGVDEACESGFCVDGVCCEVDCKTACHSCNLVGNAGSCSPVVSGQDPECPGMCTNGQCGN